jgi:hypothetical protein
MPPRLPSKLAARTAVVTAGFVVAWTAMPGCPEHPAAPADVIYEGAASDEAWIVLAEATVMDAPAPATWTFAPESFGIDETPTFAWTVPDVSASSSRRKALSSRTTASAAAWRTIVGPAVARAHLPPITGDIHRLVLAPPGAAAIRVLTTLPRYTPSGDALTRLRASPGPIGVELVHAYLVDNRILEGPTRITRTVTVTAAGAPP